VGEKENKENINKKKRRRKRKKRRSTKKLKQSMNTGSLTILHANPRGFTGKKESIVKAANKVSANVVTLNETLLTGKNKLKLPCYHSFTKNRKEKLFGGISTSVHDDLKEHAVCVGEGEGEDEFHCIRLGNFVPPITVVNCYGEIEGRCSKEVVARWGRLKKELDKILHRGEHCLLVGDLNKHVGNDELGVDGNHAFISPGGRLVRDMVQSGDWFLLNNLVGLIEGGPFTRVDPATGRLSCLDYALASVGLRPYVVSMVIDSARKFASERPVYNRRLKKFEIKYSDHFSFVINLENLPTEQQQVKKVQWNLAKKGGWDKYKDITEDRSDDVMKAVENESSSIEDLNAKFESISKKIKFQAFGKSSIKQTSKTNLEDEDSNDEDTKNDDVKAKELLTMKQGILDKELAKIKESKQGRVGQVFQVVKLVQGSKKDKSEANAIKHPETGELLVSKEMIKKVTVEYCKDNLTNKEPHPKYKFGVELRKSIHKSRMEDVSVKGCMISEEDFYTVLAKFKRNNKRTHDFLMRASKKFQDAVYSMCRRMLKEETFPRSFQKTTLQMIWKKKGRKEELPSNRFIHGKEWLPRTAEALTVGKMKEQIQEGTSCFQIGGKAGHRPQEHLFAVKSIMAKSTMQRRMLILGSFDFMAYFDREGLFDVSNTLYEMSDGSDDYRAALRCWVKLNESTVIRCSTPVGMSDWVEVGPLVGQGSAGASLASAAHLDRALSEIFTGSEDALSYGSVLQAPYSFQDDVLTAADSVSAFRSNCVKMDVLAKQKNLTLHPVKCCYILCGSKKQIEEAREEIVKLPVRCGDFIMKEKKSEKWLGDILSGEGVGKSALATLAEREGKI
jgi:hypothetical protein